MGTVHGPNISKDACCDNRLVCGPINIRHHDSPDGPSSVDYGSDAASGKGMLRSAPNPAHTQTTISYTVEREGHVKLEVYNLLGQRVETLEDTEREMGEYSFLYYTSKLPAGQYRIRFTSGKKSYTLPLTVQ
jgi:hypothetical protein